MLRSFVPRIRPIVRHRSYISKVIEQYPILGEDVPSSRFGPSKWIPDNWISEKNIPKHNREVERNEPTDNEQKSKPTRNEQSKLTEDEKTIGLDFPSSRLDYEKCLLCYSAVCPFLLQNPCYPS